jgi:K+-transporting ATPase A subunit
MFAILNFAVFLGIVLLLAKPVGWYMQRVFSGESHPLGRVIGPLERGIYRAIGTDPAHEMKWTAYAVALLLFNAMGAVLLFLIMRFQGSLPLNPQNYPNVESRLAFNTAVSFVTNTNWQSYAGEMTMSSFTQMVGLAVQNFVSAATGIAVAIALIRGFIRRSASEIGNFWVDVTRAVLYVLLRWFSLRAASLRTSTISPRPPRSPAEFRRSPRDRSPRRKRSRSSAPTAADSSIRTPLTRSKTRRRLPISCRWCSSFSSRQG